MNQSKITTSIFLIIGIILVVNLLSDEFYFRIDFTEDGQYTLSDATKDILSDLENPVTVKAYFSEDLPPNVGKIKKDFQDLLVEYSRLSDNMLVYEFVNPNEKEELEQEALQNGIQPIMINVREKDQMKQQKAFLGALIQMGEQKEVIPFMQPGTGMEYTLSTSIKKISVMDKPSIALITGHGEAVLVDMAQANKELSILYNVEEIDLGSESNIPDRFKTAAIVRPTDTIPINHLDKLDAFLAKGGNLFIAFDKVKGDLSKAFGSEQHTGLSAWLKEKGLRIEANFVIDANCGTVGVQQQQGVFSFNTQIQFPYLPRIVKFSKHPVTSGLEGIMLPFASTINYTGDTTKTFTGLAFTSEKSGTQPTPLYFNVEKKWSPADFPFSNLVVAAALEGKLVGQTHSKMVVVADGEFPVNGPRAQQQLNPDNVSLMVNSIDWLSDDTGLINLRTKGVTTRPIKDMEDSEKSFVKYLNFLLPLIIVIIIGIVKMQITRSNRIKQMEESYD